MVGAAVRGRLTWLVAEVVELIDENPTVRTIVFDCPGWPGHLGGQHIDLRLTAEDGYQAQRSYSISAPADDQRVAITVEVVDDGEVSPYLVEELREGDRIELRGPIGGYFVWRNTMTEPLHLVGGGSGVAPLMAILRSRVVSDNRVPVRYVASARTADRIIYSEELARIEAEDEMVEVIHTLTREHPPEWTGHTRRVDRDMLSAPGFLPADDPEMFVCGPTGFVETVATILVEMGHDPARVKTERFGPSGG